MSREDIDKAIYDPQRYESLRERGVGEDRAKRVATAPLRKEEPQPGRRERAPTRKPLAKEIAQQQTFRRPSDPPPAAPGLSVSADPDL